MVFCKFCLQQSAFLVRQFKWRKHDVQFVVPCHPSFCHISNRKDIIGSSHCRQLPPLLFIKCRQQIGRPPCIIANNIRCQIIIVILRNKDCDLIVRAKIILSVVLFFYCFDSCLNTVILEPSSVHIIEPHSGSPYKIQAHVPGDLPYGLLHRIGHSHRICAAAIDLCMQRAVIHLQQIKLSCRLHTVTECHMPGGISFQPLPIVHRR